MSNKKSGAGGESNGEKKKKNECLNVGHRARLRERMLKEGLQNFEDHELLELMLFNSIPRRDTNGIAHELLNEFGSVANVVDAPPEKLMMIKGIYKTTACEISMIKEVWQRYLRDTAPNVLLKTPGDIALYTQVLIAQSYVEKVVVVYVDSSTNFLMQEVFTSNSTNMVTVDIRKIISTVIRIGAAGVILFHCHVKGPVTPSQEDDVFTEQLFFALACINTMLLEHIIFNNANQFHSYYLSHAIQEIAEKYNDMFNR